MGSYCAVDVLPRASHDGELPAVSEDIRSVRIELLCMSLAWKQEGLGSVWWGCLAPHYDYFCISIIFPFSLFQVLPTPSRLFLDD